MTYKQAVFFDKDGTLIENIPYNVDFEKVRFAQGAKAALLSLSRHFQFHIVTNQAGVALGYFDESALTSLKRKFSEMFTEIGVTLEDFHYCPHHPQGVISSYAMECSCRKPNPGMILEAARRYGIDLSRSWMVGDILDDIEAGKKAGCRTVLIDNGNETEWILNAWRTPDFKVKNLREVADVITSAEDA